MTVSYLSFIKTITSNYLIIITTVYTSSEGSSIVALAWHPHTSKFAIGFKVVLHQRI